MKFEIFLKEFSERMTAFTEADRKRILESLTSEDLATLKEAFTVYDKNNDGTITTKVCNILIRLGGADQAGDFVNLKLHLHSI